MHIEQLASAPKFNGGGVIESLSDAVKYIDRYGKRGADNGMAALERAGCQSGG